MIRPKHFVVSLNLQSYLITRNCLLFMRLDVSSTILRSSQNKTIFRYSTVNFSCTSDTTSDIYWKYGRSGRGSVYIFDSRGRNEKLFDERYVKTINNFTTILTIHNVQESDAGTYICGERTSPRLWAARLTVIG